MQPLLLDLQHLLPSLLLAAQLKNYQPGLFVVQPPFAVQCTAPKVAVQIPLLLTVQLPLLVAQPLLFSPLLSSSVSNLSRSLATLCCSQTCISLYSIYNSLSSSPTAYCKDIAPPWLDSCARLPFLSTRCPASLASCTASIVHCPVSPLSQTSLSFSRSSLSYFICTACYQYPASYAHCSDITVCLSASPAGLTASSALCTLYSLY